MTSLDDMTRSLKELYQKLTATGKRTAALTRLRMELTGLDRQRREAFVRLGERVDDLKRSGRIFDAGLLGLLDGEFESIDRIRKKIQDTMRVIQEINLEKIEIAGDTELIDAGDSVNASENLLDSFEVL